MKRRGTTLQDYNLVDIRHEKVSPFVKFEIILPLLCFLLDPLTNKHCMQGMEFYDKLVDRFQDLSKVNNLSVNKEYDAVTLIMLYLKVLHDMVSQNS